jgi:chemotaxis protein methyltransferase CheR
MRDFSKGGPTPIWTGEDLTEPEFAAVMALLWERRQFRLDQYKDRCVRRRIAKRLRMVGATDFASYLIRLRTDEEELDSLLATISIHVSRFFRNPDTFRTIERHILPDLCRRARADGRQTLRLWCVGCAAGEEPYSLAMLVDAMDRSGLQFDILGTDVSGPVLSAARQGVYRRERLVDVPEAVLKEYFREVSDGFLLSERVRGMVRFEQHNIMTETTFPAADLIMFRNVLIYFSRAEQERILTRVSMALPRDGVLVLGRSETLVGDLRGLFRAEFPVERIYRRIVCAGGEAELS